MIKKIAINNYYRPKTKHRKKRCPKSKKRPVNKSVQVKIAPNNLKKILFDTGESINMFKFIIFLNSWDSFYLSTHTSSSFLFCFNISGPLNNLNFYKFPLFCKITTEIDRSYSVWARKNPQMYMQKWKFMLFTAKL